MKNIVLKNAIIVDPSQKINSKGCIVIKDKIDISVSKATQSSIKIIESLGGKIELLEKTKEKKDLKKQPEEKEISIEAAETSIKDSADK